MDKLLCFVNIVGEDYTLDKPIFIYGMLGQIEIGCPLVVYEDEEQVKHAREASKSMLYCAVLGG